MFLAERGNRTPVRADALRRISVARFNCRFFPQALSAALVLRLPTQSSPLIALCLMHPALLRL